MEGLSGGVDLLERAIAYALGGLGGVTDQLLSRPTPCTGWDLRMLLRHVDDSLDVLREGIDTGAVRSAPFPGARSSPAADVVAVIRDRACAVLGSWATAGAADRPLAIGDRALLASAAADIGAIEIAVHGWDVSRACGHRRPIPPALAADLLEIAQLVVTDATRFPLFAERLTVPPAACPSDRLVAFLGRDPEA